MVNETMEFNLIQKYFQTLTHPYLEHQNGVILGMGDDCAILKPPSDQHLVMSTDTLVEGVHFFPDADPYAIGYKSLAVSLSDLAAMGARPHWAMLSLNLNQVNEKWIEAFTGGFFSLIEQFHMALIGGNLSSGQLSITVQVTGSIDEGKSLRRSGAKPGDAIYVTGHLGDAALAVASLKGNLTLDAEIAELKKSLDLPFPRLLEGSLLVGIASAAIDISDGLAADLGHMLDQSKVGATLHVEQLPLSPTVQSFVSSDGLSFETVARYALTGGDDYELCFTVSPEKIDELTKAFRVSQVRYTHIGRIDAEHGLRLRHKDQPFDIATQGFEHF